MNQPDQSDIPARGKIRLERRPLTSAEADRLHHELKTTPNILGYTPRELLAFGSGFVAVVDDASDDVSGATFAGACLSKDLLWNWTDIALLYVLPAFRGRGISTTLFTEAFADAQTRGRHVFTLSRTPQVIHLMERLGIATTRTSWMAPLAVHLDMNWHMMSLYRWREAFRKSPMRRVDGQRFVAGMKRFARPVSPP